MTLLTPKGVEHLDKPLFQAPTIVGRLTSLIIESAGLQCKELFPTAKSDKEGNELKQLAQDIWAIDKPLNYHTDKTRKGFYVIGVCLINEADCKLVVDNLIHDFPAGTIYTLDGHRRHAALGYEIYQPGKLLGFLAWDVDRNTPLGELIDDMTPSLEAWIAGEERINIADG